MKTIFLGGAQRTGTTLLQLALCQSAETNEMLGEARYLSELLRVYRSIVRSTEISSYFPSREKFTEFHQRSVLAFLQQSVNHLGKPSTLVLKDPNFAHLLPELLYLIPGARVIILARDPRDTIASMKKVNEKALEMYGKPALPQSVPQLCRHFLSFYRSALHPKNQEQFKENVRVLRYEDLVENTNDTLAKLGSFCGIDLSDVDTSSELASGNINYKEDKDVSPWWSKNYGLPIQSSSIGGFKESLSEDEILEIEKACEGFMSLFGYKGLVHG